MIELIKELTCNSDTGGGREAAIRVLMEFIKCTALHRLLHPYLRSIIEALPLKGVPPRLAIGSLECLGDLSLVVKTGMNPWIHQLIPHTLEIMIDSFRLLGNISKSSPRDSDSSSIVEENKKKNKEPGSFIEQNFPRNQIRKEMIQDTIHEENTDDEENTADLDEYNLWAQNTGSTGIMNKDKFLSRTKSLEMYRSIQTMAATVSSNHIASSLAESRLDRSYKQREAISIDMGIINFETMNEKALKVIRRVQEKLTGTDFNSDADNGETLAVQDQVQRLIVQATSTENLCQLFIGWCAFW